MALKIIYMDYSSYRIDNLKKDGNDYYILTANSWNDYGYKTMFDVNIIKDGELYSSMSRRILFDNQDVISSSSEIFDKFRQENSNTVVDLEEFREKYRYISLGADYEQLKKLFPDSFQEILVLLNDIIYLNQKDKDNSLVLLQKDEGFSSSLCRDQSSKKVLEEGKYFLFPEETIVKKITKITAKATIKTTSMLAAKATVKKTKVPDEDRYKFDFSFELDERNYKYEFNFMDEVLPKRINILIGKNGSGKSQTLKVLSEYFIKQQETLDTYNVKVKTVKDGTLIDSKNINFIENIIVVAYSPYEDFTPYSPQLKDYQYLGFRRLQEFNENVKLAQLNLINHGCDIAVYLSFYYDREIKEMVSLNQYGSIYDDSEFIKEVATKNKDWSEEEVSEVKSIYMSSIKDIITDVSLPIKITFDSFKRVYQMDFENLQHEHRISDTSILNQIFKYIKEAVEDIAYISLCINDVRSPWYEEIESGVIEFYSEPYYQIIFKENDALEALPDLDFSFFEQALVFLDSNYQEVKLSSGQTVFINLIINLLSMIKKDSLVIIDEPENTLHPNFEVKFIEILYRILDEYKSFSIIATHSAIITREIPKKFVHIIDINEEGQPEVLKPVINTFGGNLTHINNYIFDDLFDENKQFKIRLKELVSPYDTFDDFRKDFEDKLNYEMLIAAKQYLEIK